MVSAQPGGSSSHDAPAAATERSIGLLGATGIGVGAIVGGGLLALAGVAFAAAGPSALLAFVLNGVIAMLTALSFAELSTRFPQSGGTYTFAKKVLSVEAAFSVGWVVWFASIVAGVMYALGFGTFAALAIDAVWRSVQGPPPGWLVGRAGATLLAAGATVFYLVSLTRRSGGGGPWPNVGKLVAFSVLIAAGLWALAGRPRTDIGTALTPFFTGGPLGLFTAMGYTFIALQGFDLIAAVAGQIRDPVRTIPRAMFGSLCIALLIYLPLLLIVATVGLPPGQSVTQASAANPEALVANAARNILGSFGYWLIIAAAILAMLSALQANLLAGAHIVLAMAHDRTLPRGLDALHPVRRTPMVAALLTGVMVVLLLVAVPDLEAMGAASSLVFLITFALAHRISIMARRRGGVGQAGFRTPWFPLVPAIGAVSCLGLAVFQGVCVPAAGLIACLWLALGGILYTSLFARRARTLDAHAQALDPDLVRLRGRSPLVLVPIANPAGAEAMVGVASALAPPEVGRVLLLSVVVPAEDAAAGAATEPFARAEHVVSTALAAAFARRMMPEALTTIAAHPWSEIIRVARAQRCESLLLGLSTLTEPGVEARIEALLGEVGCDVVVLRAPPGWRLRDVRRVLVPMAGRGGHEVLRSRLLASLHRLGNREITLARFLPESATERDCAAARRGLARIAEDEVPGQSRQLVLRSDHVPEEIARLAAESDLVIMGLRRLDRRHRVFGEVSLRIARETSCAMILISQRG